MKKLLTIMLAICMIAFATVMTVSAASAPYDTAEDAIAAIGLKGLGSNVLQDSIYGSEGYANEECYNLFDDDVATKFCTGTFPVWVAWQMDKAYSIGGMIVATANDNASYTGRIPDTWILYGSSDDENWVKIAEGTSDDFEDTDFTYYTIQFDATAAYEYFKFEVEFPVNVACFQMSELILCEAEAPPAVEEVEIVDETPTAPAEVVAEATTTAPVTTAPQTSDAAIIAVVMAIAALAACVVLKKKAVR